MSRVLITGMSGVGKSTVAAELARRGHRVVDADRDAFVVSPAGEWLWDESEVTQLLDAADAVFIVGTASNQVKFYDRFDRIVLLTAPIEVLRERIQGRTTNTFGKSDAEWSEVVRAVAQVEPLLRSVADVVIEASRPLRDVVDAVERVALP